MENLYSTNKKPTKIIKELIADGSLDEPSVIYYLFGIINVLRLQNNISKYSYNRYFKLLTGVMRGQIKLRRRIKK